MYLDLSENRVKTNKSFNILHTGLVLLLLLIQML